MWEKIEPSTYRMKVQGGWLYLRFGVGLCFVPFNPLYADPVEVVKQ